MKVIPLHKAVKAGVDYVELGGGRAAVADGCKVGVRGLGDALEAAFRAMGVKAAAKVYERATGKPCGCAGRRDKLNKAVPF